MRKVMQAAVAAGLLVVIAGCSAPTVKPPVVDASWRAKPDDRRQIEQPIVTKKPVKPKARAHRHLAAVDKLLNDAAQHEHRHEIDQAESVLERAQRIDPDDYRIYYELAKLKRSEGEYRDALSMIEVGLSKARTKQERILLVSLKYDVTIERKDFNHASQVRKELQILKGL